MSKRNTVQGALCQGLAIIISMISPTGSFPGRALNLKSSMQSMVSCVSRENLIAVLRRSAIGFRVAGRSAQVRLATWQVSSAGRVKSAIGCIGYGALAPSGYRAVNIQNQNYYVHRLVAAAFLGAPPTPESWQIHHIDGEPSNNCASNLQYVTPAENLCYSWRTRVQKAGVASNCKPVLWRPCGGDSFTYSSSQKEVANQLGIPRSSVSRCCRGVAQKARGGDGIWYELKWAAPQAEKRGNYPEPEVWQSAMYPGQEEAIVGAMVSSHGRVSFHTRYHRHSTFGHRRRDGYFCVTIQRRTLRVHRLVAATFLGQPESADMHVNHKDRQPGNNQVWNLEYVTPSQNQLHSYAHGRQGKSGTCKAVEARLCGLDAGWQHFQTIKDAALYTGFSRVLISKVCRGDKASHPSWEFRFAANDLLPDEEWRPVVVEGAKVQIRARGQVISNLSK